jgi:thiol-disulfide isomerase/thioredoxin
LNGQGLRLQLRLGLGRLALGLIALLVLVPGIVSGQEVGLPIGTVVKGVRLEDLEGKVVDLGEVIGKKPVLLEFWATWCPLCEALEPRIDAAKKKYGNAVEFVLVAVAVNQSQRSILRHIERHPLPARVLWDTEGRAVRALEAPTTSYIVVLDRAGRVVYTGVGEDQNIDAAVAKVVNSR